MRNQSVAAILAGILVSGCRAEAVPARDIVYTSSSEEQPEQIWLMRPDGSGAHPVAPGLAGVHESFAVWSPDGSMIAFMSNRHDPGGTGMAIFVMGADGANLRRVGPDEIRFQAAPDYSPDGRQIVFSGGASPFEADLYIMNADGSGLRRLTDVGGFVSCPRWSPSGATILFSRNIDELRVVDVASGQVSEVLPPGVEGGCGDWSPDGSKLAFSAGPDGQLPKIGEMDPTRPSGQELYVFDLVDGAVTHFPEAGPQSNYPRWSRDGGSIVYQCPIVPGADRDAEFAPTREVFEICAMNADGSGIRRITDNSVMDVHPNW